MPTCCSCHIDGYREEFPPATYHGGGGNSGLTDYRDDFSYASNRNKYSTLFDEEEDFDDYDNVAKGSIAYQYSNGFRKAPSANNDVPPPHSYADIKYGTTVLAPEAPPKKTRKPSLGPYLTPPSNKEFDGDGSYQRRIRRPVRKHVYDQANGFNQNLGPVTFNDFQSRRRVSVSNYEPVRSAPVAPKAQPVPPPSGPLIEKKPTPIKTNQHLQLPSISTASASSQDLGKRVNYNYHPIIDFFHESTQTQTDEKE